MAVGPRPSLAVPQPGCKHAGVCTGPAWCGLAPVLPGKSSRACGWLLVGLSLTPRGARADAPSDARDLFDRARKIRGEGDCASAVALFREAYAVYPPGLGSLRNVAECEQALGHFALARRAWLDLGRAASTSTERKYEGW